ncbi:MAG: hypothetical protein H7301_03895 [Cryobacterium sp.]|nr:hypothetical protein [Oligoflexia bacterium]
MRKNLEEEAAEKVDFGKKLQALLKRTDESIKLMREQISRSQSAPFLAELYMELGDLLAQKSNALYYLQMEKRKGVEVSEDEKAFSPIIQTQKEAIEIYRRIITDFPKSTVLPRAKFRLALSLKSIDEIPEFLKVSEEIIRRHPQSEEAMRTQILLGQYYFEKSEFDRAKTYLRTALNSKFVYERSLARYRLGLIDLAQDRHREALTNFELVISEKELTEQENPYEISLKNRQVKTDLRREALVDSVRAYTYVFPNDPKPVEYYAALTPTESLFQEVIEKLALRYVYLKKYEYAVRLFRTLSERIADPQKIIEIYREVLLMIPRAERVAIPVPELRFLMERFNQWLSFYEVSPAITRESYDFFEKNIRELATSSHDFAKAAHDPVKKKKLLERAVSLYQLYLQYFNKGPMLVKMATNLADSEFMLRRFMESGDYYLRTFSGEFGPIKSDSRALIENAIFCLQKEEDRGYYENIRRRGLLIKAIASNVARFPEKRNQPKLLFTSLKAQYEQSLFPETLEALFLFAKQFKSSPEAVAAGDLIIDYYATRTEYAELDKNIARLQAIGISNVNFSGRLALLRKQAKSKALQEKVRAVSGYDDFSQGRSYLSAALQSGDQQLANEALSQALARSKAERDIATFLETGRALAERENDAGKRASIYRSIGREQIRIALYYDGIRTFEKISSDSSLPLKDRQSALVDAVQTSLLLRDWNKLADLLKNELTRQLPPELKNRIHDQTSDLLIAGLMPPQRMLNESISVDGNGDLLNLLYKFRNTLPSGLRLKVDAAAQAKCSRDPGQAICVGDKIRGLDAEIGRFNSSLKPTKGAAASLGNTAQIFQRLSQNLQTYENTGEASIDGAVAARAYRLYRSFATYLSSLASVSPEIASVLTGKAQETLSSAKIYLGRCQKNLSGSRSCDSGALPSAEVSEPSGGLNSVFANSSGKDPKDENLTEPRKNLFAGKDESQSTVELAENLYRSKNYSHSAALSASSLVAYPNAAGNLKTILGCSVLRLGLLREARYHLKESSELNGWKSGCSNEIQQKLGK